MTGYYLSRVRFENGVMETEYDRKISSQRGFFKAHGIDPDSTLVFQVKGYRFNRVYLTKGSRQNGTGWAFHKAKGGQKNARI